MLIQKFFLILAFVLFTTFSISNLAFAVDQPTAIFHAHDEQYQDVSGYVCELPNQGYTHIQIAPAQKSNPEPLPPPLGWAVRYQPVDYRIIDGRGDEIQLKNLVFKAHSCNIKVIADVVFNHMANMVQYRNLNFPTFGPKDFHNRCPIVYDNKTTNDERNCWLNEDLPDLIQNADVLKVHKDHLQKLVDLGIDGFRFDAAKHMDPGTVREYINFINQITQGKSWNYLEVIEDVDTNNLGEYTSTAAITDFRLCKTMMGAFSGNGDFRSLRIPDALNDSRSVTFGVNHDTDSEINPGFPVCRYGNRSDAMLANAYVLARESGTPLILGKDNLNIDYTRYGVKFRQTMIQRGKEGMNVKENVLKTIDSQTVLLMERGSEGFFIVNKGAGKFDVPIIDLTLTNLDGCYKELRNSFTVAIERRSDGKKYVTRWGTRNRGGMAVEGRDALYFIREPFNQCTDR
jgi:alpha-amylase